MPVIGSVSYYFTINERGTSDPVLKKAKPPFEVELEFASFPKIRILLNMLEPVR